MSELDNIKETHPQETQCDKETEDKSSLEEKPAEEAPKVPEPIVTGNSKVAIVKHELLDMQVYDTIFQTGVDFAIKNISDATIATLIFEAIFYDKHGNELDTQNQRELDIKPGVSRGIVIKSKVMESDKLKSYNVRIVKTTTTEIEKVQIRRKDLNINVDGGLEFNGTLKNISDIETDAAVVATFVNHKKETIGDKVVLTRNLEPGKIKKFSFKFKPQEGDTVDTFNIKIVSNVEEIA